MLVKGTITVAAKCVNAEAVTARRNDKQVISKHFVTFKNHISELNNTRVDNLIDLHVLMTIYNLSDHSPNYIEVYDDIVKMCQIIS